MRRLLSLSFLLFATACVPDIPSRNPALTPSDSATFTQVVHSPTTELQPWLEGTAQKTALPETVVLRPYVAGEWRQILSDGGIWDMELAPDGKLWMLAWGGSIGYREENDWHIFTSEDHAMQGTTFHFAIASDNSVWMAKDHVLFRYKNRQWTQFQMPCSENCTGGNADVAVDSQGVVWISTGAFYTDDTLYTFWDNQWGKVAITDKHLWSHQVMFTPNGDLWVGLYLSVGRYDGKVWKIFSTEELGLFSSEGFTRSEIAADRNNNIYILDRYANLAMIEYPTDRIRRIPFPPNGELGLAHQYSLFIDSRGVIWVSTRLRDMSTVEEFKEIENAGVAYYKDGVWTSFVNLPFNIAFSFNELPDGTILVGTMTDGIFQFTGDV
jgi:streptogramin lyase